MDKLIEKTLSTYPVGEITLLKRVLGPAPAKSLGLLLDEDLPFEETCNSAKGAQYVPEDLEKSRDHVRSQFLAHANNIQNIDLKAVFQAYDREWFQSRISKYFESKGHALKFQTATGKGFGIVGICSDTCDYTITIPARHFNNATTGTVVAGLRCRDTLDCFMRVLEHELVHLIIFTFCDNEYLSDQHSPLFLATAKKFFGHATPNHQISF
jgi:hypothetical protein